MKKEYFEKICNFSALWWEGLPSSMAFCTLGPIWSRNARLARWGRSTPFPHAYRENRPIFQSMGFPWNPSWILSSWCCQNRRKACQPQNMANSEKTAKKSPKTKKNGQKMKKKYFWENPQFFSPLMRGTAKQHGFLHIGTNLVAKRALGQMGQIHPISTCI